MRILSCSDPQKVFNKYLGEYVVVPCGKCSICQNRRAAHYTALLERERLQHSYCFFVTLTYSEDKIPILMPEYFGQDIDAKDIVLVSNRQRDNFRMVFDDFFPSDKRDFYEKADIDYYLSLVKHGGINYASKTDVQLFLKRLNKYSHDKITNKFKNFRYFIVSEYGSTTFRGHLHGIFYVDSQRLAERFSDAISSCWQQGITDCQFVESSACAYVAQYTNKSVDMPYVYEARQISPFFLCSRNPFIGNYSECEENDREIVDKGFVTEPIRKTSHSIKFDAVPLQPSRKNRLFPKCPLYGSIPRYLRNQFYLLCSRFGFDSLKGFMNRIYFFITHVNGKFNELADYLQHILVYDDNSSYLDQDLWMNFDEYSFNFLRRLYYCSKRVARQACQFGYTVKEYIQKIYNFYNNWELYKLKCQYELQTDLARESADSCALMYPAFLLDSNISLVEYAKDICSPALLQIEEAERLRYSNKRTHFKNAYLESLALKRDSKFLYLLIKNYLYGKKCNETLEAFAS